MKKINYIYSTLFLLGIILSLPACKKGISDIPKVEEKLVLKSSSASIALDENKLKEKIVTFSWEPARPQSDDHMVTYTTRLDIVGNNFGAGTTIMTYEDDGVYSKSFTSEQINNWATQKWGIAPNKTFTLEFRVVAEWQGGATFEAPEVRTIQVNVTPIKTVVFDADKVFLGGSAIQGINRIEMPKTLENLDQYAYVLNLQPGELQIPVETNGETNYIVTSDGDNTLNDGNAVSIKMRQTAFSWKIETAGQYRVVVNMKNATAIIYSPDKALTPRTVTWSGNNSVVYNTVVEDLFIHGNINNWGAPIKMNCTVSLADPQILVYTGARVGRTKFIVYGGTSTDNNNNLAYTFTGALTSAGLRQDQTLVLSTPLTMSGGSSGEHRNSYLTIPAGTNVLIFDLRKMTILAEKR